MRIFSLMVLMSCSTMHFDNGVAKTDPVTESWHHIGILGLVEFSDPVQASVACQKGWASVKTQRTFIQGIVAGITNSLYGPFNAQVTCK